MSRRLKFSSDIATCGNHRVLAAKLAPELVEILIVVNDGNDDVAGNRSLSARCPGFGIGDKRKRSGLRNRPGRKLLVAPTAAKRTPALQMDICELPLRQLRPGPVRRGLDLRRAGESRAVHIREV